MGSSDPASTHSWRRIASTRTRGLGGNGAIKLIPMGFSFDTCFSYPLDAGLMTSYRAQMARQKLGGGAPPCTGRCSDAKCSCRCRTTATAHKWRQHLEADNNEADTPRSLDERPQAHVAAAGLRCFHNLTCPSQYATLASAPTRRPLSLHGISRHKVRATAARTAHSASAPGCRML